MYVCKNCGQSFAEHVSFCNQCGSAMIEPEATPYSSEPAYGTYGTAYGTTYTAPVTPAPSRGGLVQAIISMALGIEGLIGSLIAFICSCVAMGYANDYNDYYNYYYGYYGYSYYYDDAISSASTAIAFALIHLAFGIVAIILSGVARRNGSTSAMPTVGKVMGIISTIVSGLSFIIALAAIGTVS